jgi:hypothetical protein
VHRERDHRDLARLLDDVGGDERFLRVRERLADHEVDARVDGPLHLLLEHRAHRLVRRGVGRVVDVGVADVAREQRARFVRDLLGDRQRLPVDGLEVRLAADDASFSRCA